MTHADSCCFGAFDEARGNEVISVSHGALEYRVGYLFTWCGGWSQHSHSQVSFLSEVCKSGSRGAREGVARLGKKPSLRHSTTVQGLEVHHKLGRLLQGLLPCSDLNPNLCPKFVIIPVLTQCFCNQINEQGENAAWKALGYKGVAPEVLTRTEADYNQQRPLGDNHINAKEAGGELKTILAKKGFSVVDEIPTFKSANLNYSKNENDIHLECDVVIVGSGSGGGVMAAALAKQGFKVVVLEKGNYFAPQDVTTIEGPGMVNLFEKMGCMATDNGGVSLIAGTTVGGGTAINWCVSFKTPENVRNEWVKDHGVELFNTERYDLALQAVWERLSVQPHVDQHSLQNAVLQEGCKKLGFECTTLQRNSPSDHYCGWCSYGCPSGKKQSTAETWLVDAVKTGNAVILSNCNAEYVFHGENPDGNKGRKAQGVVATIGDGASRIFVKAKATVVACGALMTPVLLLRSGFRNPNIGKYLRLHPASSTFGYFPEGTGPEGKAYEGGIMTICSPLNFRKPTEYGALLETAVLHPAIFASLHAWRSGNLPFSLA